MFLTTLTALSQQWTYKSPPQIYLCGKPTQDLGKYIESNSCSTVGKKNQNITSTEQDVLDRISIISLKQSNPLKH